MMIKNNDVVIANLKIYIQIILNNLNLYDTIKSALKD